MHEIKGSEPDVIKNVSPGMRSRKQAELVAVAGNRYVGLRRYFEENS